MSWKVLKKFIAHQFKCQHLLSDLVDTRKVLHVEDDIDDDPNGIDFEMWECVCRCEKCGATGIKQQFAFMKK